MAAKSPLILLAERFNSRREAQWLIEHLAANGYEIVEKERAPIEVGHVRQAVTYAEVETAIRGIGWEAGAACSRSVDEPHDEAHGWNTCKAANPIADNAMQALGYGEPNPFNGHSVADTQRFSDLMKTGR